MHSNGKEFIVFAGGSHIETLLAESCAHEVARGKEFLGYRRDRFAFDAPFYAQIIKPVYMAGIRVHEFGYMVFIEEFDVKLRVEKVIGEVLPIFPECEFPVLGFTE